MKGIEYLKQVLEKIDSLSDEEFMSLLVKSGLNECPYEVTFNFEAAFTQKPKYKMNVEPVIVKDELMRVA